MAKDISRRRMITITAGAIGGAMMNAGSAPGRAPYGEPLQWRGVALGSEAEIRLYHRDRGLATKALEECVKEIRRLEGLFSLYKKDSQLSQLNRKGIIENPDFEMVEIISRSSAISELTDGAFDITVQPLWRLYSEHFAMDSNAENGPTRRALDAALGLVDYRRIDVSASQIKFSKKGMMATLNGIAQGYITNRVAMLLEAQGWRHVLVNLGELQAIGSKGDGKPWRIGIADPDSGLLNQYLNLNDGAIATSAGAGTKFTKGGKYHHLFDPRLGMCTNHYRSVSVMARDATFADGLSTAFSAMPLDEIRAAMAKLEGVSALITNKAGETLSL